MSAMASQIIGASIVCPIHRWQVDSPHKGPVAEKVFIWWHHHALSNVGMGIFFNAGAVIVDELGVNT